MAKKTTNVGSPIGDGFSLEDGSPAIRDNNPDGPSRLPDDGLGGYDYNRGKKICFANDIGKGEGKEPDNVIVQTANGISRARGQNKGQQGNWSPDSSWAEDRPFKGGNLTGM